MSFQQLSGLEKPTEVVLRAISTGHMTHALLLSGPAGNGKIGFANAIAEFLNCTNPTDSDSCGVCAHCTKIRKLIHPDVHFILPIYSIKQEGSSQGQKTTGDFIAQFRPRFIDNNWIELEDWVQQLDSENKQVMIGVDEIRDLKRKLSLRAFEAKYKVVIIWHAEKMRTEAANALLKLLEEPPANTILILTTDDPSALLATIRSRCQQLLIPRIDIEPIQTELMQRYHLPEDQARQVALMAEGSVRKAQQIVERDSGQLSDKFQEWMRLCFDGRYDELSRLAEDLSKESREFQKYFLENALQKLKDTLHAQYLPETISLFIESDQKFLKNFSKVMSIEKLNTISELIDEAIYHITRNANAFIVFTALSLNINKVFKSKTLEPQKIN